MNKREPSTFRVYCMRHQEAAKHADGRRDYAASLSQKGKEDARALVPYLSSLDANEVWVGTLPRHLETLDIFRAGLNPTIVVRQDPRLNAIPRSSFLEQPAEEVENKYHLDRFSANTGELYQGRDSQGEISFNPASLGVYPFDPFVCRVHLNERLRNLVFPEDKTFEQTREAISSLHNDLRANVARTPYTIATIGSGSVNRILQEYTEHGTVGEHLFDYQAKDKRPFFSQRPDHLIVLGNNDSDPTNSLLKVINPNVSIKDVERSTP